MKMGRQFQMVRLLPENMEIRANIPDKGISPARLN